MNGAEALARTLVACGVDTCFANPGTSEMHFVAALDRVADFRPVLGLAETVVGGCADGYARMSGRPAAALFHCGPGLANGLAALHNARRAHAPVVALVGDHARAHRLLDPPLAADTEALARTVSLWVRTVAEAGRIGADAAQAVHAARSAPGGVATLVVPADCAWTDGTAPAEALAPAASAAVAPEGVREVARILRRGEAAMLLLGGAALLERGLRAAARVAEASGAALRAPTQVARMARGRGRPAVDRVPYVVDQALATLAPLRHLVLVGARAPVGFFAYPGKPSRLWPPDCTVHVLARPDQDAVAALEALADELGAVRDPPRIAWGAPPEPGQGPFRPDAFGRTLAALLPEDAIVCEDAVTSGRALFAHTFDAPPNDWIQITGGAIGFGFPAATGAAIACPGRRVVCLQSDGGGMYSVQALWTQARERTDVVNVVFANRRYAILQGELVATGARPGRAAAALFDLAPPELDWVRLAGALGVEAARVETLEDFADRFRAACAVRGPFLIEFRLP